MPKTKRKALQESSEGEDFGKDDFSDDASDDSESEPEIIPENPWKPIAVEGNKKDDFVKALKSANLKIEEQRKEIRNLKLENANLRRKDHKISTKGKEKERTEKSITDDQRISLHARKFCVMNEIFVPESAFLTTDPDFDPMDRDRYSSEDFIKKGIIAELFEEVPKNLHQKMQGSGAFRDLFVSSLNQMRRSIIHTLKNETSPKIFPNIAKYQDISLKERRTHEAFKNAIMLPGNDKVTKFAPILFEGGKKDMKKLFKCKHLALMLRSIFFGPSSLNNDGKKANSPKTNGKLWGISQVTPGAIAAVSVFAIYLHSCDDQFRAIGATSQINYQKIFNQLKEIIIRNSPTPPYQKLFAWFNRIVFNWNGSDAKGINSDDLEDTDSGVEDAILQLDELDLEDDNDNPPADIQLGPSQENSIDQNVDISPNVSTRNSESDNAATTNQLESDPIPIQGPSTSPVDALNPNVPSSALQDDNQRHGRLRKAPAKKKLADDEPRPSDKARRSGRRA